MSDSGPGCPGPWRSHFPARSSNRPWPFGKARRPKRRGHSERCCTGPGATGPRAAANTVPRWKGQANDAKHPAIHETGDMAKIEGTSIMKPNADPPKAPESEPGAQSETN